ncbi:MAG: excinuclease ABC subunit UvrB [Patescibacteria group bacterium]
MKFKLQAPHQPTGDQPRAIKQLTEGLLNEAKYQTLLGVTGSGKTFTMANLIENVQKPTLVIAHNKTLAAQLYQEFRDYFPENAVNYFVSYYDYYQPEAYIPSTDTYIEKEAQINDEIDKLRLAATTNLLTRPDVIIVASVSCIYNLGSPHEYDRYLLEISVGDMIERRAFVDQLANLQYERSDLELRRGTFRIKGDIIQIWPAYEDMALKIDTLENRITSINQIDPISGLINQSEHQSRFEHPSKSQSYIVFPAKHHVIDPSTLQSGLAAIRNDLERRINELNTQNKQLEAYRLKQKVNYDIEMIEQFGFVAGIENYSRYFDGRKPGQPPYTLLDYLALNAKKFQTDSFLTFIDESHITVPQIRGMYRGDQSRKATLIDYGFRLPSAIDNRPLQFSEFLERNNQTIYVSATPNEWEIEQSKGKVIEQLIRPTGLTDPTIEIRPTTNQIEDLVIEVIKRKTLGQRTLVTTLTKKMAETLTDYLNDKTKIDQLITSHKQKLNDFDFEYSSRIIGSERDYLPMENMEIGPIQNSIFTSSRIDSIVGDLDPDQLYPKVAYLHSDIETLERSDILDDLRLGKYDVLVGINLLREGLDLPEVTLVAILDADKEGFLRSATSMIQTIGRAARHIEGKALLYADKLTISIKQAIEETQRRRRIQVKYNTEHGINPKTINKPIRAKLFLRDEVTDDDGIYSAKSKNKKTLFESQESGLVIQLNKQRAIDLTKLNPESLTPSDRNKLSKVLRRRMTRAANELDFELAAILRDHIHRLED